MVLVNDLADLNILGFPSVEGFLDRNMD